MTPTRLPNLLITYSMGSVRSESLEMTTASSKSPSKQSISSIVARFTSERFSSVLSIRTV